MFSEMKLHRWRQMSFIITVNIPEIVVMASDSRQSISLEVKTPKGKALRVETT